jgi:DivIVA domain-containing protein
VSYSFPSPSDKTFGYDKTQVDKFIDQARAQFQDPSLSLITSDETRRSEFDLVLGGYEISRVDAAMETLENEFAAREIKRQKLSRGELAVEDRLARLTEIVSGRLERKKRQRFKSTGFLIRGYHRAQVDSLCESIQAHLINGAPMKLNQVRRAVFTLRRGGYAEAQVDAFLDRVMEILHIETNR